jgi:FkbM family methyltransferase
MKKTIKSIVYRVLKVFNITLKRRINSKSFYIPILGSLGVLNLLRQELWMIDLLKIIIQIKGNKFIDVGTNIGQTLLKIKSVKEDINYIGFEPNPSCVHYTNKLIRSNKLQNVSIFPFGISTKTEQSPLNFYDDDDVDSSASIIEGFRDTKVVRQEYIVLFDVKDIRDSIDLDGISILKIDVEGSELEVIQSFKSEIKKSMPFIIMEILPVYNIDDNPDRYSRQNEIHEILNELGYTTLRIIKNKKQLLGFNKVFEIGVHSNLDECDYLFIPKNNLEQFNFISQKALVN